MNARQRPAIPVSALSSNYRALILTPPTSARVVINDREFYCKAIKDFSVLEQINAIANRQSPGTGFAQFKQKDSRYVVTFEITNAHIKEKSFQIEDFIRDYILSHERYGDV